MANHSDRKHALLSASGASRWMACTPSARLEDKEQDSTSVYAAEGTLAHEFADIYLRYRNEEITKRTYSSRLKKLRANKLYTDEMEDHVEKYTDFVLEQYSEALVEDSYAEFIVEQKVNLTDYIPEGFGTCDAVIVSIDKLRITDLKYGKGIAVRAEENTQLMLYALGALRDAILMYDIETVEMTIVQPRLDSISSWTIPASNLIAWGENEVIPKARAAYNGEGELVTGDHCRFCRVKHKCTALSSQFEELAKSDFTDPNLLHDEEILEYFQYFDSVKLWIKAVEKYLLSEAVGGKEWKGLKIVQGRSNRKWKDEEAVIAAIKKAKLDVSKFTKVKLLGIGNASQQLTVDKFDNILKPLIEKPQGKPTLVDENDPRKPFGISQALEDFKEDYED